MRLTLVAATAVAAATAALAAPLAAAAPSFQVANDRFERDGAPFTILSGSIHYFRVRPELWEDRLRRLKAMGLNAITFVIPWNFHTTGYRQYDFSAPARNLSAWLSTAQSVGLLALVRPGPYICAEHDAGGFPWYLYGGAAPPGIQLRTNNSAYLAEVDDWWAALLPVLKPHLYSNGGNVALLQLENEYGSFGDVSTSPGDREYIVHLKSTADRLLGAGAVTYYTTDGGDAGFLTKGALPGVVFATGDGNDAAGMFAAEDQFNPPGWRAHTTSEFYPGWLTHWGEAMANTSALAAVGDLTLFFALGGSANLYMAHGGTNWGFQSGANAAADGSGYSPLITSYDYSAPLAEGGGHGWAVDGDKFAAFRTVLDYWNPEPVPDEPPAPAVAAYGALALTQSAPLWGNQDALVQPFADVQSVQSMEWYNLSAGWALYTGTGAPTLSGPGNMYLGLGSNSDLAATFGTNAASLKTAPIGFIARGGGVAPNPVQGIFAGNGAYPDVLLENQGRIGYGHGMQGDAKSWGGMTLGGFGGDMGQRVYGLGTLDVSTGWPGRLPWAPTGSPAMTPLMPTFFRGTLTIAGAPADTYVSTCGWGKGVVWVNGVNLGRYWDSRGPQHTLYVPATLLRTGANDVLVFEVNTTSTNGTLEFVAEPDFTGASCKGGSGASASRYPTLMLDPSMTARGRSRDAALSADIHEWRARRAAAPKSHSSAAAARVAGSAACGTQPPAADSPLTLQPCSVGAASTQWALTPAKVGLLGGHLALAAAPSLCLAPAAAAAAADAAAGLALAACNATDRAQDWLLFPSNAHAVMSPVTGTFLHSPGSATAPGTPLVLEAANAGAPNQQWAWDAQAGQLVSGLGSAAAPLCAAIC